MCDADPPSSVADLPTGTIFLDADNPQHPLWITEGTEFEIIRSTAQRVGDAVTVIHFVKRLNEFSHPRVQLAPFGGVDRIYPRRPTDQKDPYVNDWLHHEHHFERAVDGDWCGRCGAGSIHSIHGGVRP